MSDISPRILKYTIGFCFSDGQVLLVQRKKKPNQGKWNGLGGKIEPSELPQLSFLRELTEEADIDVAHTSQANLHFRGLVTWDVLKEDAWYYGGMYVYVVELPTKFIFSQPQITREGPLLWHPTSFITRHDNQSVVDNIPYFASELSALNHPPTQHHFIYHQGILQEQQYRQVPLSRHQITLATTT